MMDTQSRSAAVRIYVQQVDGVINESERGSTNCLPIEEEADLVSDVEDVNSIVDDKEVNSNHESVPTPIYNLPHDPRKELLREVTRRFLSRTQNNRSLLPGYGPPPISKLGSSRESIDVMKRRISHRRQVSSDTILSGVSINRISALAQQTEMGLRSTLQSVRMAMRKENVIQTYEVC